MATQVAMYCTYIHSVLYQLTLIHTHGYQNYSVLKIQYQLIKRESDWAC